MGYDFDRLQLSYISEPHCSIRGATCPESIETWLQPNRLPRIPRSQDANLPEESTATSPIFSEESTPSDECDLWRYADSSMCPLRPSAFLQLIVSCGRHCCTPILPVLVEKTEKAFYIHRGLLQQHSDFFRVALRNGFQETRDDIAKLPEDDVLTFGYFTE
jgi:hypothetical protein